ncbi:alpha-ketoglutarate-dependent taurine dioxygenase [Stella humosa]|uniref:Alpha-ketoglutarate-dependent taurine dioxygenase n=1 Tax=Stella humosa TaxID=94 RepID=A0A3N1LHP8_9PROT|nr:TauD/TfdA family dioxygenase [Stella humosa]ROP90780.1 alpha-ketoglutarate-dependent taurine dioxygenase [Stella humosa]BBK34874.1 hypothetical protein STHU_55080 [Stella humosa]
MQTLPDASEGIRDRGWLAADAADPDFWCVRLDQRHLKGLDGPDGSATFRAEPSAPVPPAGDPALADILERLERGPGFVVLRGFPVDDAAAALRGRFWTFCQRLGTPIPQTKEGDHLVEVAHGGEDTARQIGRWYGSRERLTFHTDRCDILGLLFVQVAKAGGVTRIASSVAIHAEMARLRPDLLALLYGDLFWRVPERQPVGAPPFFRQPVFAVADGRLSCCYNRFQIEAGHRYPGARRLTAEETEALDLFESLAESERFSHAMQLEPGDLQLVNNHVVLHARTAYEDDGAPENRRRLLRAWLSVADSRPLHPSRAATFGECRGGRVRGYYSAGTVPA